jgi:2,5-dioxopentanoate dehydrogenase
LPLNISLEKQLPVIYHLYYIPMIDDINVVDQVMKQAATAFDAYRKIATGQRADFLESIAANLENAGADLFELAASETNLPIPRLRSEMTRTCFQLRMFAKEIMDGHWVEAIIDHAKPQKNPPAPDLRSMRIPLGPVVVFGASNFPFAYSTAGGDTASALAAGCPVVVKQHPAHANTSSRVFEIIQQVMEALEMPAHVVQHVADEGFATGKALVQHPNTAAVGFTGSYAGGMALHGYASERKHPIPVFAEMGSVNPVLLLPGALALHGLDFAEKYSAAITLGMGQFCTNPGLLLGINAPELEIFKNALVDKIQQVPMSGMLHSGIESAYLGKTKQALAQKGINLLTPGILNSDKPVACIATISSENFLSNPLVHEEIFGPWSLLVVCKNAEDMLACRKAVAGQLTTTIIGTEEDLATYSTLADAAIHLAGRVIFNGVPTGVEVCNAMVHGGPHPATTDSRFTAVGVLSLRRWTRPVCWQNAPDMMLPPELKEDNPLKIRRVIDGLWTTDVSFS